MATTKQKPQQKKPQVKKEAKEPTRISVKELRHMIREAIREQISGMGMGGGNTRTGGYIGGQRPQPSGEKFDWQEDYKKAKDPATNVGDLMLLAKHPNEQVAAAAKDSISKKLFDIGAKEVKF